MPLIRKSASDVTTYTRVNATSVAPVAPNLRRPATYSYGLRSIIPPITRASVAGAGASPSNTVLQVYGGVTPMPPPPPPIEPITGSLFFDAYYTGTSPDPIGSWITVSNPGGGLSPGTADFTIEWWQYLSTNTYKSTPYVFNLGRSALGFNLDGLGGVRTPNVIVGGAPQPAPDTVTVDDSWAHFAIVRSSGVFTLYYNGTSILSFSDANNLSSTDSLLIGAISGSPMDDQVFEGYLTNFRWVVGTAVYTTNFTPSLNNLLVVPGTKLLLLAKDAGSVLANTAGGPYVVIGNGVQWNSAVPS